MKSKISGDTPTTRSLAARSTACRLAAAVFLLGLVQSYEVRANETAWTNEVLGYFAFEGNGRDGLAKSADVDLNRTRFEGDALFINGEYENRGGSDGIRAIASVPGLNYESLAFSLHFYPLDFEPEQSGGAMIRAVAIACAILGISSPRSGHSGHQHIIVGGRSYRWLGYRQHDGCLELTLNNQEFIHRFTNVVAEPGRWHSLISSLDLKRGKVLTILDGQRLNDVTLPADFALRIIDSPEAAKDKEFTFTNYSNGEVFHGYAARLRILGRALTDGDLRSLIAAVAAEAPRLVPTTASRHLPFSIFGVTLILVAVWAWRRQLQRQGRRRPERPPSNY